MASEPEFRIDAKRISNESPPYFIADIAANHDGDLERAKDLIFMAAEAGAHAAKFQHFSAETLVSDVGFKALGNQLDHQAGWKKSVFEVYEDASLDLSWTATLAQTAKEAGITFLSTPYSLELAAHINPFVSAFKIGSGDITYLELIRYVSSTGKPWILATGASKMEEIRQAVAATSPNPDGVLMQCNTNYTGSADNFRYVNLNVLLSFRREFPNLVLGLSDHTPGHATVLGAIALGARVFEKHFTDDTKREGPDHAFSMDPKTWREMIDRSTETYLATGSGEKVVEKNELQTVILQRRCLRTARDIMEGETLVKEDLVPLRPAPVGSLPPEAISRVIGRTSKVFMEKGSVVHWNVLA